MADDCRRCGMGASNPHSLEYGKGYKERNNAQAYGGYYQNYFGGLTREAFIRLFKSEPKSEKLETIIIRNKRTRSDF